MPLLKPIYLLVLSTFLICNISYTQSSQLTKEDLDNYKKKYFNTNFHASGLLDFSAGLEYHKETNEFLANYRGSVNVNLSIFGCSLPINYIYTNGRSTYDYNLNTVRMPSLQRFGISPEYKWIKLHLGYRTMDFSKYTYSGGQFKGVGLELTPGNFEFKFLQGTLRRSSAEEDQFINNFNTYFARKGTTVSLAYQKDEEFLKFIVLKAYDDENSLNNQSHQSLSAAENTILSFQFNKRILDKLFFNTDFAFSAYTPDKTGERIPIKTQTTAWNFFGLFEKKEGSHYDKAFISSLIYKLDNYDLDITYEEVDPLYKTLGSLFFNNNYKNYTVGSKITLIKDVLQLRGDIGVQTQYLDTEQTSKNNRIIASVGSNYKINENTKVDFQFSNNQNTDRLLYSTPGVAIDSINLVQTNVSLQTNVSHSFGEKAQYQLNAGLSFRKSDVIENEVINPFNRKKIYGAILNLNHTMSETDKITYGVNFNLITGAGTNISNYSPAVNYSRTIKENLNMNTGITYNLGILEDQTRNTFNFKANATYDPSKKLSLSLENTLLYITQKDKNAFDIFLNFKSSYKL